MRRELCDYRRFILKNGNLKNPPTERRYLCLNIYVRYFCIDVIYNGQTLIVVVYMFR